MSKKFRKIMATLTVLSMMFNAMPLTIAEGGEETTVNETVETQPQETKQEETQQEAPKQETKSEAPKSEAPKSEAPKSEAPKSEAPKSEPKVETNVEKKKDEPTNETLTVTTTTTTDDNGKDTVTVTIEKEWTNQPEKSESTESGSTESGSTETGSTETGSTETGSTESGSTETGSTESGSTESGSTETGSTESGSTETDSTEDTESTDGISDVVINGSETTVTTEVTTDTSTKTTVETTEVVDGEETREWTEADDGSEAGQPEVEVDLIPGETTTGTAETTEVTGDEPTGENDENYDYTETTTTEREVTAETSDVEVTVNEQDVSLEALQPELKFDRNDEADQKEQQVIRDLYTDNGHFTDPSTVTIEEGEAPDGYSYKLVGDGDYSGHYVSKIRIIYERDEEGNPIKDENGEYVINHLEHSNGTILTKNGEPTTDINGPFDQTTGTRPQQFMLMDEEGNAVYAYCIDVGTGAKDGKWYQVSNLEDNTYYASEDSENHIRAIVTNGYWGTTNAPKEDGSYETGSIAKIREDMKAALAESKIESEYDITFVIRGAEYTEGYELKEGEYVGNGYVCKQVTEHIVLTPELIDAFTEGEAMDATQSAIWSYANGSNATLDGTDRMIVGDVTYASSALGDSRNGQNDFAGAARTKAFYNYLMNLEPMEQETIIINEKNNVKDVSLTVKDKVADHANNKDGNKDNDVYHTELNFQLAFIPGDNDDLLVQVKYTDLDGKEVAVIRRLAGTNAEGESYMSILPDENGNYVIENLQLSENKDFGFDIRLEGTQYLENGVYVYTAQGGVGASQTMVGMAEGTNTVDVTVGMTISFDVDEDDKVVAERKWHSKKVTTKTTRKNTPSTPNTPSNPGTPTNRTTTEYPVSTLSYDPAPVTETLATIGEEPVPMSDEAPVTEDGLVEILDEEVPLAAVPQTGDGSGMLAMMSLMSLLGVILLAKKKETAAN